jgi:hypothetical protein
MKPLSKTVDEDLFLRWLDGGPLTGQQKLLAHGFLQTSVHQEEFLHKAVSIGASQTEFDYICDGLALATMAAKKGAK